ncbi:MAG TPA: hypothetical protein VOA19_04245, partial [Actinomycetes bacterium]|nr:hypothetical protein [Actinomycetes bacterium]
ATALSRNRPRPAPRSEPVRSASSTCPALAALTLAALAIGAVAGLYPALRAARLAPTDALRTA